MFRSSVLVIVLSISFKLAQCSPFFPPTKIYDINRSVASESLAPRLGDLSINPGRNQTPTERQAAALVNAHETIQAYHNAQQAATLARMQAQARQPPIAGHLAFSNGRTVSRADRQASAIVDPQESLRSYRNAQHYLNPANGPEQAKIRGSQPVYTVRVSSTGGQALQSQKALAQKYVLQHRKMVQGATSRQVGPKDVSHLTSMSESVGENNFFHPKVGRARFRGEPTPFNKQRHNIEMQESKSGAFKSYADGSAKRLAGDDLTLGLQSKFPRLLDTAESSTGKASSSTHVPSHIDTTATKDLLSKLPWNATPEHRHIAPSHDVDTSLTLKGADMPTVTASKPQVDTNLSL